ncbi:MAG: HD-GYP domain-containing protein [Clostridia bacterium]|nr:HD-GYP domain-containing protein [Clostridia bacterium]
MRAIPIQFVQPNSHLGEDLYTAEGKILLRMGTLLTENLITKIKNNKIFTVYIIDIHSDIQVNRLLEQSFRAKGTMLIKAIFDDAASGSSILDHHYELSTYADDVLYELKSYQQQTLEYVDVKNVNAYLYSSALNIALISSLIAWHLGYNDEMVKHIFIGAIYHDIGIALLPPRIIYKDTTLTTEEKMMIINHPSIGYKYVKERSFLSAYTKTIVYQHHECLDGTGYPQRIKGNEVHPIAQIVGVADVYDAMTSDRPYKRAVPPNEALEYIIGVAGTKFDSSIVDAFIKMIAPYPRGSIVRLSNGSVGVVETLNKDFPLRPVLNVITKEGDSYHYESLNLIKHPNLVITETVYDLI